MATCLFLVGMSPALAQITFGQVTKTPNASAYVTGYCLGGILAVPSMVRVGTAGATIIIGVSIVDNTGTNAPIDLFVFDKLPTGTYTDHANCTVATADQPYLVGTILNGSFTASTDEPGTTGVEVASPALPVASQSGPPVTSTNLWVVPIVRGTPTYGVTKTLTFDFFAIPASQ